MTADQFLFWVSGYLSAYKTENHAELELIRTLKVVIKDIKITDNSAILYTGCL